MNTKEKIRLVIIDDHQIVINGIKGVVNTTDDIELVGTGLNAEELLKFLESHNTDLILMDINLPGMDGIKLCKHVKNQYPEIKIIGLTTFSQASFIAEMLRNGADGYLFKNTSEEELLKALRTVHAGSQYLSNEVNQKLVQRAMSKSQSEKGFIPKLTRRENEVLQLIIEENTNQEIAEKLFLSTSTIETHRMNLCAKLDARNTAGLVKNAIKFGLV